MTGKQGTTPIEAITEYARYTGSVANRGYRVSDILNDANTNVLEMQDVVTRVAAAQAADVRWKQIFLKKDHLLLVIPKGSYEAPVRRSNNYVEKHHYGAMIILPGFALSGIVHLPSQGSPLLLLDEENSLPGFIGLTDVTVHASSHGFGPSHCRTVILRRQFIESMQLTAQPLPKPGKIFAARIERAAI